jgi:hypothetical protein
MAKLRVGDIVIDGANVRIGGTPIGQRVPALPRPAGEEISLREPSTPRLPVRSMVVPVAGAALSILGVLQLAATANPFSLQAYLFHGGLLLCAGAGLLALSTTQRWLARRAARVHRDAEERLVLASLDAIRAVLRRPSPENTIERIVSRSAVTFPTAVRALAVLRKRRELREELNTDTGEWYYAVESAPVEEPVPRNLDEHLAELKKE